MKIERGLKPADAGLCISSTNLKVQSEAANTDVEGIESYPAGLDN